MHTRSRQTGDLAIAHSELTKMVPPEDGGCRRCGRRWCKLAPNAYGPHDVAPEPVWGRLPPRPDRSRSGVSSIYSS